MKPALEVAKEIMAEFYAQFGYISSSNKEQVALIAEALTAYADERVKEAITKEREEALSRGGHWIRSEDYAGKIQQARAEGLEEAARIADGIAENYFQVYRKAGYKGPGNEGSQAASAAATNIRALKEKP